MKAGMTAANSLLTWLDVERVFKKKTLLWTHLPNEVLGVDCYYSGVDVRCASGGVDSARRWLMDIFGRCYTDEKSIIELQIGKSEYPVFFVEEDRVGEHVGVKGVYPLWRDITYISTRENGFFEGGGWSAEDSVPSESLMHWPSAFESGPDIISFHSFKGGVGRTTALMTYVSACLDDRSGDKRKILVVDADLEAPGISFWLNDENRPTVSFIQFMEAIHYPPTSELDDSIKYFSEELRKTSFTLQGLHKEVFILPAALDLSEIQDMAIVPEHLARNPENPWRLGDCLHKLGEMLQVDVVFIDLRAGLSELASPILFDPRVDHFFVTTVAPQSSMGMAEVLSRLYGSSRNLPKERRQDVCPSVIISLLTKELRDSSAYEEAMRVLEEAYPVMNGDPLTSAVQWLEADFSNSLMSIASVREAIESLRGSQRLYASALDWARSLYSQKSKEQSELLVDVFGEKSGGREAAKCLHEICQKAQFAEGNGPGQILAIEPLLNLGKHFSSDLPNVLMVGAKGAGKTFTFRQLVSAGSWAAFLEKVGFEKEDVSEAEIFPVLWSANISDSPEGEIKKSQKRVLDSLGVPVRDLLTAGSISRHIKDALGDPPKHWSSFWDNLIAKQFGLSEGGLEEVNALLVSRSTRMVLVFDGIEDEFNDAEDATAGAAIQALLKITNRVGELENSHLGVLVFVRMDYVQATITQNAAQLLQRFKPFMLRWDPESFLRLAYMLGAQAGVLGPVDKREVLHLEELKIRLEKLWGKKLGSERSKEAHSARWVYAALCDLKGNVQARDLVRFLKFSAYEEIKRQGQGWPDRVLSPESMRKAIKDCSEEKVSEAKEEISYLRKWLDLMDQKEIRDRRIPFSAESVGLDAGLLKSLRDIGIIYEDLDGGLGDERLFLPEIFRWGLGFETSASGRPRMQALLKKNIGVIPL